MAFVMNIPSTFITVETVQDLAELTEVLDKARFLDHPWKSKEDQADFPEAPEYFPQYGDIDLKILRPGQISLTQSWNKYKEAQKVIRQAMIEDTIPDPMDPPEPPDPKDLEVEEEVEEDPNAPRF